MIIWISVSVFGFILSAIGFHALVRQRRQNRISGLYLAACVIGYLSFAAYAALEAFSPTLLKGPWTVLVLLPALICIVIVVREHRKPEDTNST